MTNKEELVWKYLLANRYATGDEVAEATGFSREFVGQLMGRIGSKNWRQEKKFVPGLAVRDHNVGESDYAERTIQPWDIWLEYDLNPWDADIIKRVLREKPGQRRLDYEKIKHICDERIRQIDAGIV